MDVVTDASVGYGVRVVRRGGDGARCSYVRCRSRGHVEQLVRDRKAAQDMNEKTYEMQFKASISLYKQNRSDRAALELHRGELTKLEMS